MTEILTLCHTYKDTMGGFLIKNTNSIVLLKRQNKIRTLQSFSKRRLKVITVNENM